MEYGMGLAGAGGQEPERGEVATQSKQARGGGVFESRRDLCLGILTMTYTVKHKHPILTNTAQGS